MLANLPEKRAVRQIFPNLTQKPAQQNFVPTLTGLKKKKILVKQKNITNSRGYKIVSTNTTINTIGTNLALRKRRNTDNLRKQKAIETAATSKSIVLFRQTRASQNTSGSISGGDKTTLTAVASKSKRSNAESNSESATNTKNKGDIRNIIRQRTKTVVTKITNSFRRGNKRLLRKSNRLDVSSKAKPDTRSNTSRKSTFLRSLSFRKSARISNDKMGKNVRNTTNISKKIDNADNSKEVMKNLDKRDEKKGDSTSKKEETKTDKNIDCKKDGNKNENSADKKAVKQNNENQSTNVKEEKNITIEMSNKNTEDSEKQPKSLIDSNITDAQGSLSINLTTEQPSEVKEPSEQHETPPEPKLRRKRSIKSIINDICAKRQDKMVSSAKENMKSISTSCESTKVVDTSPIITGPLDLTCQPPRTPISLPLSLTIHPMDEPLNLVISPRNRLSQENPNVSMVSPPLSIASVTSSESISPRRRTRKLTDCIAMLTEKLGVSFSDPTASALSVLSPDGGKLKESENKLPDMETKQAAGSNNLAVEKASGQSQTSANVMSPVAGEETENRRRRGRKPKEISKILIVSEMDETLLNESLLIIDPQSSVPAAPVTDTITDSIVSKQSAIEKSDVVKPLKTEILEYIPPTVSTATTDVQPKSQDKNKEGKKLILKYIFSMSKHKLIFHIFFSR